MIGRRLGHYRIVEKIGAGGMGVVYRAHDEHLDRDVAVKVLAPDAFPDQAARRRFRTEALALAKLSSVHIAQVHDFASEDGVDFLAMELVPGHSMAGRAGEEPLAEAEVLRLGIQLATALEEAHGQGIVHRDLKPGNLMLTPKGDLKVLDFGLAKLARDPAAEVTKTMTEVGTVTGTVPYMAPEQLRAEPMDARTDIWAAGVVLYELATGRRPFRGEVPASLIHAILSRPPEAPSTENRRVSAGFEQVLLKCLEKDPERRYQSAAELKADLERVATGAVTAAAATAPRRRFATWWLAAAAAVVVAAIVGLFAMKQPRGGSGAPIASLAVLPLANMTGDPAQEYFADGMTESLITELAGIRSLKVISRTSVMRFKKTDKTLPEIAKQLGVEAVVEGSVARGGGRVRVTAQLIRAASDEHLWAENFDRQEADALALHSEIAGAIAGRLRAVLSPEQKSRPSQRRKVKPEAYDLVLQGNHLLKTGGSPDVFNRAIGLFEKAVALDPQSVEAHAGLANALQFLAGFGFAPYWDYYPRIRKEVNAALALEPNYAGALRVLSGVLWAERDPRGSLDALRRAVEQEPGDSSGLAAYASSLTLFDSGPEPERMMRKAIELDPLAQFPRCVYKDWLYAQRRYAEAEAQARTTLDLDPHWFWAWDQLWRIHVRQGKLAEAQEESRKSWEVVFGEAFKPPPGLSWEAYERWLERFLQGQPRTWVSGFLAADCARRGEKQKALAYLETASKEQSTFLGVLDWPEFDSIREDARFQKVVEDQKLPVAMFCRRPQAGKGR